MPSPESTPDLGTLSATLAGEWDHVKDGSKSGPGGIPVLNAVEDRINALQGKTSTYAPLITATITAIESTGVAEAVKEGIDHFFDGMPVFMNALDAVADLHPFIGVAVMAFKTVYTLELKRRDNEKKIIALYVEMKDMMAVLLQYDVRDEKLIAPDNRSIEDRMKTLIQKTADDIKACSNACDTFAKKKLIAKVFQGPMWDTKLLGFVSTFTKRRSEFEFALTIHTSQGMDAANAKLGDVDDTTKDINAKMDIMMELFQTLVSNEQKSIADMVHAKGGVKAVRNNDKLLKEVDAQANKSMSKGDGHRLGSSYGLEELKEDLLDDPDTAIQKNMVVFSRKFEVQKRQIVDELTLVVTRETDRIIKEVKSGAHERIMDKSIHEIWHEMEWRGNVKARHFVLALRDYYVEKLSGDGQQEVRGISKAVGSQDPDAWAIKFIDVVRLQPILEAFDDDASGFITVAEMNRFTSARPLDWSLAHWVAFWAVGWRSAIVDYASKIEAIFAKMEGIHSDILPPNRQSVDDYFRWVWDIVHTLTVTLKDEVMGPNQEKFTKYIESEEARLKANLEAVDYIIDGKDTLSLITGVGRPEKTVFPVLYLLMKRHYDIMKIARTKVISSKEMFDSVESMLYVKDVIMDRLRDLKNIFLQQKLDPDSQFKTFAYGIFKFFHKETDLWTPAYVKTLDPDVTPYDAETEEEVKPENVLKHEYKDELTYDNWVYDGETISREPDSTDVELPLKDIIGHWQGYYYNDSGERDTGGGESMFTEVIEHAEGDRNVKAVAWSSRGRYTVDGSCSTNSEGVVEVKMTKTFTGSTWKKIYFEGTYDAEHATINGKYGVSADSSNWSNQMIFKRIPPQYFAYYPDNAALSKNKARSLWNFAIQSVCRDIRCQNWSWSYFQQRRDDRNDFINLYLRWLYYGKPLTNDEHKRLTEAAQRISPADACFYISRALYIKATTAVHENAFCDSCGGRIGGPRVICLDCVIQSSKTFNTLDLCELEECVSSRVTVEYRQDLAAPHEPSHHLMKVRTVVLTRQHGRVDREARAALKKVEGMCKKLSEQKPKAPTVKAPEDDKSLTVPNSDTLNVPTSPVERPMSRASKRLSTATSNTHVDPEPGVPICSACKDPLTLPCWYCAKCEEDTYICNACDSKGVPKLDRENNTHNETHFLVRCQHPAKAAEETSTDQRLISLEARFDELANRIGGLESLLQRLAGVKAAEVGLTLQT
ncbi:hypothetical protein BV25DRAFT_1806058 [Artomyces pyxidatus]|uniref:Uncharacterized protein n=1 Tax=Artomyces pyxidatus TaxID=48021 RepID=A0ACB8SY82_9AGAM|nr:hypothetical protein BV25DRAFT_1806058 [Artomyces pyxidatus]